MHFDAEINCVKRQRFCKGVQSSRRNILHRAVFWIQYGLKDRRPQAFTGPWPSCAGVALDSQNGLFYDTIWYKCRWWSPGMLIFNWWTICPHSSGSLQVAPLILNQDTITCYQLLHVETGVFWFGFDSFSLTVLPLSRLLRVAGMWWNKQMLIKINRTDEVQCWLYCLCDVFIWTECEQMIRADLFWNTLARVHGHKTTRRQPEFRDLLILFQLLQPTCRNNRKLFNYSSKRKKMKEI